jgi:SAM-dependent methyltransferase
VSDLYEKRPLTEGYPDLDKLAVDYFSNAQLQRGDDGVRVNDIVTLIGRLIPLPPDASMCIVGCGPVPHTLKILRDRGFHAVGVEPIPGFVAKAREYLGDAEAVHEAAGECLPLADQSLDVVFLENVLEHVESWSKTLNVAFRVVRPGGIAYLQCSTATTLSTISLNRRRSFILRDLMEHFG